MDQAVQCACPENLGSSAEPPPSHWRERCSKSMTFGEIMMWVPVEVCGVLAETSLSMSMCMSMSMSESMR